VHASVETGVGACVHAARQESQGAAWQVVAVPAAHEGHTTSCSCRLWLTRRRQLHVTSGTMADGASARAHIVGHQGRQQQRLAEVMVAQLTSTRSGLAGLAWLQALSAERQRQALHHVHTDGSGSVRPMMPR
jgi:hypothetical protein